MPTPTDVKIIKKLRPFRRGSAGLVSQTVNFFDEVWELDAGLPVPLESDNSNMGALLSPSSTAINAGFDINGQMGLLLDAEVGNGFSLISGEMDGGIRDLEGFDLSGFIRRIAGNEIEYNIPINLDAQTGMLADNNDSISALSIDALAVKQLTLSVDSTLPGISMDADIHAERPFKLDGIIGIDLSLSAQTGIISSGSSSIPIAIDASFIEYIPAFTLDSYIPGLTSHDAFIQRDSIISVDTVIPGIESCYFEVTGSLPGIDVCQAWFKPDSTPVYAGDPVFSAQYYSMNISNGALTRMPDYNIDYTFRNNDKNYGIGGGKLYTVGSNDDDGATIHCVIETHDMDFGESKHKRLPYAYFGSPYKMTLKSYTDGVASAQEYPSGHDYERTRLCRGDHGRYWRISAKNVSDKFQIDDMSLLIEVMSRKV